MKKTFERFSPSLRNGFFLASLFVLCWLSAFFVRTWHFNREAARLGVALEDVMPGERGPKASLMDFLPFTRHNFVPYTIESAMMYGYTQDIASGKGVPRSDKNLAGLEDIPPYRQMIMGLEWFLGYGYKIKSVFFKDAPPAPERTRFQDNPKLAEWAAFQIRLWASLASAFVFLWLIVLRCPWQLALFGGLLHAVALSTIARSTGQDLVRGEFCMPLFVATLAAAHWLYLKHGRLRVALVFATAFLTMATWDLSVLLFSCWTLFEILRTSISGKASTGRRAAWIAISVAIVLNAILIPFHREYLLIESQLVVVCLPVLMLMLFKGVCLNSLGKRFLMACVAFAVLYGVWNFAVRSHAYDSLYSHFGEMMRAKIEFLNKKPTDPRLIPFDARIMWTPSMHSATWGITDSFFPPGSRLLPLPLPKAVAGVWYTIPFSLGLLFAGLLAAMLFSQGRAAVLRGLPRSLMPYLFTLGFAVGFTFIVRYHEFLMLFLCVSLPLFAHDLLRAWRSSPERGHWPLGLFGEFRGRARVFAWVLLLALAYAFVLELACGFAFGSRNYKGDIYMRQTAQLIEWFRRANCEGRRIICSFTVGPMLKAYCGMGIAIQPQYGLERIRHPYEVFVNLIYHGSERELNAFCVKYGADYLLYDKGYFSDRGRIDPNSARYMAAAVDIDGKSMANMMYLFPDELKWFYRVDPPADLKGLSTKFSVFKVIRPKDKVDAIKMVLEGEKVLAAGDSILAGRLAKAAVWLDPYSLPAKALFFKVFKRAPEINLTQAF